MGYRGYISSRAFFDERVPQRVQNLVIRDYCERREMKYLLSATEVAMPGTYLMLNQLVRELSSIDGIVCYSLFQLPENNTKRRRIFDSVLKEGRSIHFAVEALQLKEKKDISRLNDIYLVKKTVAFYSHEKDYHELVKLS